MSLLKIKFKHHAQGQTGCLGRWDSDGKAGRWLDSLHGKRAFQSGHLRKLHWNPLQAVCLPPPRPNGGF